MKENKKYNFTIKTNNKIIKNKTTKNKIIKNKTTKNKKIKKQQKIHAYISRRKSSSSDSNWTIRVPADGATRPGC